MTPKLQPLDSSVVPRYAQIATFLRAPRCDDLSKVDVGIFGVPTDQGLSFRTGTRHGPAAVREASRLIRRFHPYTHRSPFEALSVADLGDVSVHPYLLDQTLASTEGFVRSMTMASVLPIAVGGDHTVTLPVARGLFQGTPLGLLDIDAHPDTNDTFYGTKINHATMVRRLHEEGIIDAKRVVQLGLRGTQFSRDDAIYGREAGFTIITFDEYEEMGRAVAIDVILGILGDGPTYITVDIDGLDPRDAPGTPVIEPGGISMRDCQVILRSLIGVGVIGADICELAPHLDQSGVTAVNAANILFELLCVMAYQSAAE